MTIKLALIAEAGSGKDVFSDYLCEHYNFTRYAFADNVRKVAKEYFPNIYNEHQKPRWLLQEIGTKFREIHSEVWINSLLAEINNSHSETNIIITDCRMPNEYEALKKDGYLFIRLKVDEDIRYKRMLERGDIFDRANLAHPTESYYNQLVCDYEIYNNGTLQDYHNSIEECMNGIVDNLINHTFRK